MPNAFAFIILFAWPLLMLAAATVIPVRKVVLISIIGGNLFIPSTGISLPGIPDYTKLLAAGLGALLPAFIFAAPKLINWRPKPYDLFFVGFLITPAISSLINGLGPYDATSSFVNRFLEWGVAYWLGRALFSDLAALRDLCVAIVASAMIYTPLCLYEMRMSPQLSQMIYGFRSTSFGTTYRMGGWRPLVFMHSGLPLAAWMAASALCAWILWRSKAIRNIWGVPIAWVAIGLVIVTIGLRSTGAAILLVGLIATAEFIQRTGIRPLLLVMVLIPMSYIVIRSTGWDGRVLVQVTSVFGEERAGSLNMRLENDTIIAEKAMEKPIFGWGGWGRWRVTDEFGRDITVSDSWWAILLGSTGFFGLICTYATFISPLIPLSRHKARSRIFIGPLGAAWALGFGVLLFVLDTLLNALPNTSFMLMSATLVSVLPLVSPAAMRIMLQSKAHNNPTGEHLHNPGVRTA